MSHDHHGSDILGTTEFKGVKQGRFAVYCNPCLTLLALSRIALWTEPLWFCFMWIKGLMEQKTYSYSSKL